MRRWEDDVAGHGERDAAEWSPLVAELITAMGSAGWVAEDPEKHLLPGVLEAAAAIGAKVTRTVVRDGILEVDLELAIESRREIRRTAMAVIGSIAEESTFVKETEPGEFLIVTGMSGGSPFAPHGHVVRLRVLQPVSPR